mmetsp:Transcript_31065/g.67856  ORF Transcript_31065/g.67856 Transcript_31065/m.67856 type:complete len:201 (-) Transcript_31065:1193-1795(-)
MVVATQYSSSRKKERRRSSLSSSSDSRRPPSPVSGRVPLSDIQERCRSRRSAIHERRRVSRSDIHERRRTSASDSRLSDRSTLTRLCTFGDDAGGEISPLGASYAACMRSSSEQAMMEFRGVRSSWLMLAKKALFCLMASFCCALAPASSRTALVSPFFASSYSVMSVTCTIQCLPVSTVGTHLLAWKLREVRNMRMWLK